MSLRKAKTKPDKETPWVDLPSKLEMAFAHVVLGQRHRNLEEAAVKLGLKPSQGRAMGERPRIRKYMAAYVQHYMERMAAKEVQLIVDGGITRDRIARRLMELADMAPKDTRFTINGQVDAALGAARILGYDMQPRNVDDFFKGKTDEQIANYAAYGTFEKPTQQ